LAESSDALDSPAVSLHDARPQHRRWRRKTVVIAVVLER
jgi:hypothetical protein